MNYNLTEEEKAIEDAADKLRPVSAERRAQIEFVIRKVRKNQAISLRLSEFDLELLKKRAESEGLPYQTLISLVLHKYEDVNLPRLCRALHSRGKSNERDRIEIEGVLGRGNRGFSLARVMAKRADTSETAIAFLAMNLETLLQILLRLLTHLRRWAVWLHRHLFVRVQVGFPSVT